MTFQRTAQPPRLRTGTLAPRIGAVALAAMLAFSPTWAAEVTQSVAVRGVSLPVESPAQAAVLLDRIKAAAQVACGAEKESLADVKRAVRGSQCWRDSVANAVHQIDSPLLTGAFERQELVAR